MRKLIFIIFGFLPLFVFSQGQNITVNRMKLNGIIYSDKSGVTDTLIVVNSDSTAYRYLNVSDPVDSLDAVNLKYFLNSISGLDSSFITVTTDTLFIGGDTIINGTTICEKVFIDTIGDPTFVTQCDFNALFGSAGRAFGGEVTDAGGGNINIAAGGGFIKKTDSDTVTLYSFNWAANNGVATTSNNIQYVKVEYNGGVPQTVLTTTEDWDLDTSFPLAKVVNENGTLHILNNPWWITDGLTNVIERIQSLGHIVRDEEVGGLMLSVTGTRSIAVTAGRLWSRLNEFTISSFDSNVTGTFETYYRSGASTWTSADLSQYPVTQYNRLSDNTLQNLTNNWYANWWVYVEADNNEIALVYPQNQYSSSAAAQAASPPSVLPPHIQENAIFIGRIVFQQGTDVPVLVQSAFTTQFSLSLATDHGNLTGLTDDDHPQYTAWSDTLTSPGIASTYDVSLKQDIITNLADTSKYLEVESQVLSISNDTISLTGGSFVKLPASGIGDVITNGSATDNAIVRYHGTSGDTLQNSGVTIDDSNNLTSTGAIKGSSGIFTNLNTNTFAYHGSDATGFQNSIMTTATGNDIMISSSRSGSPLFSVENAATNGDGITIKSGQLGTSTDKPLFIEATNGTDILKLDNTGALHLLYGYGDGSTTGTEAYNLSVTSLGKVIATTPVTGGSIPLTTKGDLLGYSTSAGRFPRGYTGQTLISDSLATFGLRWITVDTTNYFLYNSNGIYPENNYDLRIGTGTDLGAEKLQIVGDALLKDSEPTIRFDDEDNTEVLGDQFKIYQDGTSFITSIMNAVGTWVPVQTIGTTTVYYSLPIVTDGYIDVTEAASLSTPATGKGRIQPKTDGKLYFKNDDGTEYDLTAGSGTTYTNEDSQDAVGTILTDGTYIDFTYDDGTPSITATIKANSIDTTIIDDTQFYTYIAAHSGAGSGGTVTSVSSSTTNQLTVANGTTTPALSIVTGTVANGGTALATGDQIYDFTTGLGYITGNQTITLSGDVTGSGATAITTTVADDSHNHVISNVDNLQDSINARLRVVEHDNTLSGLGTAASPLKVDTTIIATLNDIADAGGYTDEQAQDAVGTILSDAGDIDFTYDDATPAITATIKANSIDSAMFNATEINAYISNHSGSGGGGTVTAVISGAGMDFETITSTDTVKLGTPSSITGTSTNLVSTTSHTHEITDAQADGSTQGVASFTAADFNSSGGNISLDTVNAVATLSRTGFIKYSDFYTFNTKQNAIANLADTSKYIEYADTISLVAMQWELNGKQAIITNLADTSKYVEYADTTVLIAMQWELDGKQATIANLSDTSKYMEYADTTALVAMQWELDLKQNTIANLADTSKYWEASDTLTYLATQYDISQISGGTNYWQALTAAVAPATITDEVRVGSVSDLGDYKLQVTGNVFNNGWITTGGVTGYGTVPYFRVNRNIGSPYVSSIFGAGESTNTYITYSNDSIGGSPSVTYTAISLSEQANTINGPIIDLSSDTTQVSGLLYTQRGIQEIDTMMMDTTIAVGNLCVLTAIGMELVDADDENRTKGMLGIALESGTAGNTGKKFLLKGNYVTSGLTKGATYYISNTAGAWTSTRTTTANDWVRVIGYAKSATVLYFDPSPNWIKLK